MRSFCAGLLVGLLLAGGQVAAQGVGPPPVEVHIQDDDLLDMYNCWPGAVARASAVTVYLNYPDGSAAYGCTWSQRARVIPLVPRAPGLRLKVTYGH